MNITDKIKTRIDQITTGDVFGYAALGIAPDEVLAASKALSRLTADGVIRRAKKGLYYKPKQSAFGELKPREDVLLSQYLYDDNKQVAYITGTKLYNRLGLTTQVPNSVRVACAERQVKGRAGNLIVKPAKSYVKVTAGNVRYLELLDVIKDLNTIPDLNKKDGIAYLKTTIGLFDNNEVKKLVSFGIFYPPKVKALLGALLEDGKATPESYKALKNAINPMSQYEYSVNANILPNANAWNIV